VIAGNVSGIDYLKALDRAADVKRGCRHLGVADAHVAHGDLRTFGSWRSGTRKGRHTQDVQFARGVFVDVQRLEIGMPQTKHDGLARLDSGTQL
jgi:hypothetical protein